MEKTKRESLIEIGFKELPHKTITNGLFYDLGRNRALSIGDISNPNEMLYILEIDEEDETKITNLVCLHNYDYDGYITLEKIKSLISAIGTN